MAQLLVSHPEVIACDRVSGNECFIAKAFVANGAHLESLLNRLLLYAAFNTSTVGSKTVA